MTTSKGSLVIYIERSNRLQRVLAVDLHLIVDSNLRLSEELQGIALIIKRQLCGHG